MAAWQGARRERGFAPVTDERRCHAAIFARRHAVALGRSPDVVRKLARADSPRCGSFLAGKRPNAIPMGQNHVITL